MHIAYVPILHAVIKDAQGKFTPEKCKTHMEYCEGLEPQEMRDQIYQDFIYEYTEESMSKRGLTDSPYPLFDIADCLQEDSPLRNEVVTFVDETIESLSTNKD